jgi:hypothetical protein
LQGTYRRIRGPRRAKPWPLIAGNAGDRFSLGKLSDREIMTDIIPTKLAGKREGVTHELPE